jgi:transglutaminase-like putative cysteine protease
MKTIAILFSLLVVTGGLYGLDKEAILEQAGSNRDEIKHFIAESHAHGYDVWADFLLTSMEDVDLVNLRSCDFLAYFDALKRNRERVPWGSRIDGALFQHYILPHRVSQEPLENFTALYADTLYELIKDVKDMREAVLRINEWTFTKMKYEPTARWDQDAMTTIQRGFGRCEEMAILCIKAMRAVCIPARKVYAPWWPFTNSNHAWIEVWIDGRWHFLGGAEPTDLEHAWFNVPAKRAAMVMGVVYGEIDQGNEVIYRKEKGYTVINSTPNYAEVTDLRIRVLQNGAPQESVSVSLCVYNYSSLPPVGVKKTDGDGFVSFTVGRTDLFVYAARDSFIDFRVWKPTGVSTDTMVLAISQKIVPDTSFWMHTKRIEKMEEKPSYEPNRDSLKLLQALHLERICMVDSSLASVFPKEQKRKLMVFYNAKGRAPVLLGFCTQLPDSLKETFIAYCDAIHPKDVVSIDTTGMRDELTAVRRSIAWCRKDVPDSILTAYVISDRILFEHIGMWRTAVQDEFITFKEERAIRTATTIFDWVDENIEKVEKKGYFGPMKHPLDVWKTERATDGERYLFAVAILRCLGIPARIKWSYDALEFWDEEWQELRFEANEHERPERWLGLQFFADGEDVTTKYRYYYDYSITRFEEYPSRLDPPVDTTGGTMVVSLDDEPSYVITGWRNGYGDTYVRLKRFEITGDTLSITVETGIPSNISAGDLIVREYRGLDLEPVGMSLSSIERGKVLIVVFDTETEASKSTLLAARDALNGFSGSVFFFVKDAAAEKGKTFLRDLGINYGSVVPVSKEVYRNQWNMRDLPAVLHLRDGTCVFWTEGLFLHLSRLLEDLE